MEYKFIYQDTDATIRNFDRQSQLVADIYAESEREAGRIGRLFASAPDMHAAIKRAIVDLEKNINPLLEADNLHSAMLMLKDLKESIMNIESE